MIKVENLKKTYDRHSRYANEVLHGISLELPERGFVCILGSSGCGKTTLLNAIGGLDSFDGGKIITENEEITRSPSVAMERERNARFGYIFQNYYLLAEHSAAYNVYLGMHSIELPEREKKRRVKDALARVDMQRYASRPVCELSGGQQQRVAIARAIARRPEVIFADEPTGNLDEANTINICKILKELSRESLVLMVTHEERIARLFADRIITLKDGEVLSDSTDFQRSSLDGGAKDTLYSGDYTEKQLSEEGIELRVLYKTEAPEARLTVVVEKDRIIIKSSDPRVVLSTDVSAAPYLVEGNRPTLNSDTLECISEDNVREKTFEPQNSEGRETKGKKGIGLRLLAAEARRLASGGRLKKFGAAVFIIILSFMMAVSVADVVTVASIDPEDFISSDSHLLEISFARGEKFPNPYLPVDPYVKEYYRILNSSNLDFDFLPRQDGALVYTDETFPQIGKLKMNLSGHTRVNISRFDEGTLIHGRAPLRSDEIVVDRWVLEKTLAAGGVLENTIPDVKYFLGRALCSERSNYSLTIVGISDSGEPAVYMSKEALLATGVYGSEVITLSEYRSLTGDTRPEELGAGECYVLSDNVSGYFYPGMDAGSLIGSNNYGMRVKGTVGDTDDSITARIIIADEALSLLYNSTILSSIRFDVWCEDKEAMRSILSEPLPEKLSGIIETNYVDRYSDSYAAFKEKTEAKLDARALVTIASITISVVMLYLMQRSRIRERMDLVAVYRLLGIKKRSLVLVFALENLIQTVKCALPTVLGVWLFSLIDARIEEFSVGLIFPLWAAALTLVGISIVRLTVAVLPLLRLLSKPPARLAASYDL